MTDPFAADLELQKFRKAQQREYSTWVATGNIFVGSALAYRAGDPVPVSNVDDDGRVIIARHVCGDHEPCGHQNEPIDWTDPGMVRPAQPDTPTAAARPAKATGGK